jgi:hypothetical protein
MLAASQLAHHTRRAMMLAVPAAAGRENCVAIGGKERRYQCPTEEHQQRNGGGTAHKYLSYKPN